MTPAPVTAPVSARVTDSGPVTGPVTTPVTASFTFEIRETLSRFVTVEAECFEEAFRDVRRQYNAEEIVLNADDFIDCDILWVD